MITNTMVVTIMFASMMALGVTAFSPFMQAMAPEHTGVYPGSDMENTMKDMKRIMALNDLDNDSIANCEDPDDDGDGINDTADEYPHDHDNDGIPDWKDKDDDNNGINDTEDSQGYVGNTSEIERMMKHLRHRFHKHKGGCMKSEDRMMRRMAKRMKHLDTRDMDGDGIPNCEDPDDDGDGINDTADDYPHDANNDGIEQGNNHSENGHHGSSHNCGGERKQRPQ